jgi:multiple sugar transport system permease protein
MTRRSVAGLLGTIALHAVMYGLALITVAPFLWMVLTSFKELGDILTYPPSWWPRVFVVDNYVNAFQAAPFGRYYANSLFVALAVTAGQVVTCSMAAYAFARLHFRGRDVLFYLFIGTMMIPGQVTMIPAFMVLHWLGWIDSYPALIVPGLASAFGTFLMRQFFMTIPRDLDDAAAIDGCGKFALLWRIILPLSRPALATLAVFHIHGRVQRLPLGPDRRELGGDAHGPARPGDFPRQVPDRLGGADGGLRRFDAPDTHCLFFRPRSISSRG